MLQQPPPSFSIRGATSPRKLWMASRRSFEILLPFLTILTLASSSSSSSSSSPFPFSPRHGSSVSSRRFWIEDDMFWKDDRPFRIIGGDVHYFRIVPEYWRDRLLRAKALGLNTIQTYVPWNLHEPQPQRWNFEGIADLESFLELAQELGFLVMLRAGPYICAEWDLGGFPAWLLAIQPPLNLRSSDSTFLSFVDRWWGTLLPKVAPLLYANGGPVIMVQVENEFGSFGDDRNYLHHLVDLARRHLGTDTILYTTDGGSKDTLEKGTIPEKDIFAAVDFTTGDDPWPIFKLQKKYNLPGKSPPLSAEFYTGWLTHWGENIATTDANFTAKALQRILSLNGSAVLYMAHGGTNFGFFSGANTGQNESDYKPDLTSYDYDAPIKEYGDVDNPKFKALSRVIHKYTRRSVRQFPLLIERASYGPLKVRKIVSLFEVLYAVCDPMKVLETEQPVAMELAGQMSGFLLYVSEYSGKKANSVLSIPKVHDRAQVFVACSLDGIKNPTYVGVIERWSNKKLAIPNLKCSCNTSLFIMVENMGRINYGPYIYDRKGILSAVTVDGSILQRWKHYPITFDGLGNLSRLSVIKLLPGAIANKLSISASLNNHLKKAFSSENEIKDTFISFRGWNKGIAFVNNFNIGRFWPLAGPQCTLYVPAPILQHGRNVIVILELHSPNPELTIDLVEDPDFSCGLKRPSKL
ncbi:beta-galactosidase 8 isoform X2 [Ananas comosus]|uniref:Beta-galactosidase n=1 Tax=Ananas comosus TaxID=4615 RepID=A0A6P5FRX2_ANACO|nr:beta-galactosidase 8 isoform X2 [Ananas comosus]